MPLLFRYSDTLLKAVEKQAVKNIRGYLVPLLFTIVRQPSVANKPAKTNLIKSPSKIEGIKISFFFPELNPRDSIFANNSLLLTNISRAPYFCLSLTVGLVPVKEQNKGTKTSSKNSASS